MNSVASRAQFEPGPSIGDGARSALLLGGAAATAAVLVLFGTLSLAIIPAAVAVMAIMAKPELGLYGVILALALPIPVQVGTVVLYPHDCVAAVTLVAAAAWAMHRRDFELPPAYYTVPAILLLSIVLVSMVNTANMISSTVEVVQQFYLLFMAPVAYYLLLRKEKVLARTTGLFMGLMAAEAVLACMQFFFVLAGNDSLSNFLAFGRVQMMGGLRVFGTIDSCIGLLFAASALLWLNHKSSWTLKAPVLCLHVFGIFATGTRSAMLAFIVMMIFYGLFARRKALTLKLMVPCVAAVLVFAGVMGFSRFSESLRHKSDSMYRMPIDRKALDGVPEHPIVGHGPKSAAELSTSIFGARKIGVENEYVARLYENGLLGLLALLVFAAVPVLWSVQVSRGNSAAGLLAATLGAVIVGVYASGPAGGIFEGALGHFVSVFYAMMLAAATLSARSAFGARRTAPAS